MAQESAFLVSPLHDSDTGLPRPHTEKHSGGASLVALHEAGFYGPLGFCAAIWLPPCIVSSCAPEPSCSHY